MQPDPLIHDRANELRQVPDLWPLIANQIPSAVEAAIQHVKWFAMDLDDYTGPALRNRMREKYEKGEKEHNRNWLQMTPNDFHNEVRAEIIDLIVYLAMRQTRWVLTETGQAFDTNRDPGDETDPDDDFGVAV